MPWAGAAGFVAAVFAFSPTLAFATLAGAFLSAGLVDELLLYVAPVLLGERARPLFHGLQIDAMAQRLHLRQVDCRSVGEDLRVLLRPAKEDR